MRNVKFLKSLSGKDFAAYLISFHFGLVFHALAQKTCKSHVYNAMQARCVDSYDLRGHLRDSAAGDCSRNLWLARRIKTGIN
jgi:hypothetical protein